MRNVNREKVFCREPIEQFGFRSLCESVLTSAIGCKKLPTEFHFGTAEGVFLAAFFDMYLEPLFLS
jgi:hypothetical protein